jgi:hypothetical protein
VGNACSTHRKDEKCVQNFGGRLILECILGKQGGKGRTGFIWLRIGISGGPS